MNRAAMTGAPLSVRLILMLLVALAGVLLPGSAWADCGEGNLLASAEVVGNKGVRSPELLSDGWTVPDGSPTTSLEAAVFTGSAPSVTWELSDLSSIVAIDIQADSNEDYVIQGSVDGSKFWTIWEVSAISGQAGLVPRYTRNLKDKLRFVRLLAKSGDNSSAVTEVRVFCRVPTPWPAPRLVRLARIERPESTATYQAFSGKIVVALVGLFLVLVVAPRVGRKCRSPICVFVIALSALGWTHFGQFQGKTMIHTWDMFHYYVGSKYYEQLGYKELYRCIAKLERERGNTENYRGVLIRDLDDNTLYPFLSWASTEEGRCRGKFSKEEWKRFGEDIDSFRAQMISPPFEHVVGDHGFNATPYHATWLSAVTKLTRPTARTLRVLAQIDSMALLVAVLSLGWGFGLRVAAVSALLIQLGAPWSYNWVGGGLGRHVWFALACLGLAFLRKEHFGRGTAALTGATLLRFFPIVFLGGLGAYLLSEWARTRQLSRSAKRSFVGLVLTLAVGTGIVLVSYGPKPFTEFTHDIRGHADAASVNRLGFPHLLSLGPGKTYAEQMDQRLTDPSQPWKDVVRITREERKPLWYLAVFTSLGVLGWVVWTLRNPWLSVLAVGPLLYSLQEMTSYDYMWLVLLVPAAFRRQRALVCLCAFVIFSQGVEIAVPDVELRHWLCELALFPTVVVIAWDWFKWGMARWERPRIYEDHNAS